MHILKRCVRFLYDDPIYNLKEYICLVRILNDFINAIAINFEAVKDSTVFVAMTDK